MKINSAKKAKCVKVDRIFGSTYDDVQDFINIKSAGKISGGELTAGTAVVNVAAGIGMIKTSDSSTGINKFFDWDAVNNVSLTDDSLNYIYVDYNVSTEAVTIAAETTLENINLHTQIPIGLAFRDGNHIEILDNGAEIVDAEADTWHRLAHRGVELMDGAIVAESPDRYLTVTAGSYYKITKHINTDAIDTSGADTFTAVYQDGGGNWTFDTGHSQFSNILYDDGDGTPGNVGVAKYATYYVYQCLEGDIYVQYGQSDSNNLVAAQNEAIPTPPNYLNDWAQLRAKIIILRGATNAISISNYTGAGFTSFAAGVHNELGGLQGGTTNEYYHLTSAQHTDVPLNTTHRDSDGSDHSKVTDNETAIALNTTHRSSDGKDHSDVVLNNTHRGSTENPHSVDETDILPSQTGNDDKFLKTNGSISSWADVPAGGVTRSGATNDNRIPRWNGASADSIQNSLIGIDDSGHITPVNANTQNIGSATHRFGQGHFSDGLVIGSGSNITASTTNPHLTIGRTVQDGSINGPGNASGTFAYVYNSPYPYSTVNVNAYGEASLLQVWVKSLNYYGNYYSECYAYAEGKGSMAGGYMYAYSYYHDASATITAGGDGSFVHGFIYAGDTSEAEGNGRLQAGGAGAWAGGHINVNGISRVIEANANGSFAFGSAANGNIVASAAGAIQFGPGTNNVADSFQLASGVWLRPTGSMFMKEQASALADIAGWGQLWVKNTDPCELWFTDDAGTDTQIV